MVTEAVGEMKGEPQSKEPSEIKLDVPTDAFLPTDYVAKEELRLEAYRRLAAVTTPAEVDDIRTEWEDRYGPVPDAGRGAARRSATCAPSATGWASPTSRSRPVEPGDPPLSPLDAQDSARDAPAAARQGGDRTRTTSHQLVVPIPRGAEPAAFLVGFLDELIPVDGADR